MKYNAALVTGAADRLGAAFVRALAENDIDVAIHYATNKEKAENLARECDSLGVTAVTLQADLLDNQATHELVARASTALGKPLDILINNASIFEYDNLETATDESWHRHLESNLHAPFILTQHFAKQAPKAIISDQEALSRACVINMIDQRVKKLTPEFMTYTIAKMGLWAFTQTAAQSLAPNVRVNGIAPGPTLIGHRQSTDHFSAQRKNTILNRGSDVEDIVSAMQFLLSAKATTGQLLCIDGGQSMAWETPDIIGKTKL